MTITHLILALGALVLSILMYFAGVQRTKRRYEREDTEGRINRVVDMYIANSRSLESSGFHGLIQAGVWTLKTNKEIREACRRIVNHGEKSPFGKLTNLYEGIDLYEFFSVAKKRGYDFLSKGNVKDLALELSENSTAT